MITQEQAGGVIGGTLRGADGERIGKIGQVFVDDVSGRPEWVTVHTGLFGTHESFVPVAEAQLQGDEVSVPFDKGMVKDAPNVDPAEGHLSEEQEAELYRYYGMTRSDAGMAQTGMAQTGMARTDMPAGEADESAMPTSAMPTSAMSASPMVASQMAGSGLTGASMSSGDATDDAMTRSEEQLRAGTETVRTGRARLRKWVETEQQQVTVPVTTEHARLVSEPVTAENVGRATSGPDISEAEHEVTLHAERPVVSTETVPVERVRLETETETHDETVSADVRKERIDLDAGREATAQPGTGPDASRRL
ncbi:DUF2382 domain-containing protein [Motilibacter aurantiacus]|uniref:DUF2382 domain-containing protein n=1 Tax=Motilibacter aurantiacus TaxID=2714955 RepID=UPI00140AFFB4|nr:PRC and DUF2382 domain-containing protein [Motilibacter aurantiacus]NHC44311.1 PRC and DUF2382 domain-containing protein [Motilibacter aurantiacus]